MTADWIDLAWKVIVTLMTFGIGLHQWLIARDRVRREQLASLEREIDRVVDEHSGRITRIETRMEALPEPRQCAAQAERMRALEEAARHAPKAEDLAEVYRTINPLRENVAALRADVSSIKDGLAAIRGGVERLTEALLRREDAHR